jgi:hypothetical protein
MRASAKRTSPYETERPRPSAPVSYQLSGNAGERRRQIGAEAVYGSYDSDRHAGRDKTISDCGRPAIVLQEASYNRLIEILS